MIWRAVRFTGAAHSARVLVTAGVGVAIAVGVGTRGLGMRAAGVCVAELEQAARVAAANSAITEPAARPRSGAALPPPRRVTRGLSRRHIAAPCSLGWLVVDAVRIEEARRTASRERPDHLVGGWIHNHDPAVVVVADRDAVARQGYGDG